MINQYNVFSFLNFPIKKNSNLLNVTIHYNFKYTFYLTKSGISKYISKLPLGLNKVQHV